MSTRTPRPFASWSYLAGNERLGLADLSSVVRSIFFAFGVVRARARFTALVLWFAHALFPASSLGPVVLVVLNDVCIMPCVSQSTPHPRSRSRSRSRCCRTPPRRCCSPPQAPTPKDQSPAQHAPPLPLHLALGRPQLLHLQRQAGKSLVGAPAAAELGRLPRGLPLRGERQAVRHRDGQHARRVLRQHGRARGEQLGDQLLRHLILAFCPGDKVDRAVAIVPLAGAGDDSAAGLASRATRQLQRDVVTVEKNAGRRQRRVSLVVDRIRRRAMREQPPQQRGVVPVCARKYGRPPALVSRVDVRAQAHQQVDRGDAVALRIRGLVERRLAVLVPRVDADASLAHERLEAGEPRRRRSVMSKTSGVKQ